MTAALFIVATLALALAWALDLLAAGASWAADMLTGAAIDCAARM
jgi:hypothetical protein